MNGRLERARARAAMGRSSPRPAQSGTGQMDQVGAFAPRWTRGLCEREGQVAFTPGAGRHRVGRRHDGSLCRIRGHGRGRRPGLAPRSRRGRAHRLVGRRAGLFDGGLLGVRTPLPASPASGRPAQDDDAVPRPGPKAPEGGVAGRGRRLVAPLVPWLGEWGLAIEQHHESFNGSGYPFGLSGDGISLGARIVAVADAFEVMTAIRSYKKALSPVAARQELTRCAGSQFDPAIVRALLNVSIGRVRWVIGPVSWVADVPLLARLSVAGHALVTTTQVAVGAAALTAAGALAAHAAAPTVQTPVPTSGLALAAPTTTALAPRPAPPVTAVQTVASTASLRITAPRPTTMHNFDQSGQQHRRRRRQNVRRQRQRRRR